MTVHTRVVEKTCRSMSFALMVAFLSLGAISGCDLGIDDDYDFLEPDRPEGGLGVVDPDAGIYPNIQVIQPFLNGAMDPIKVQYWDQTYYWGPDSEGNDACFKGTVGIEDSSNLAQETAPGPECPTSLGQVTPCNPAAAADTVASGAVQPAISGCERGGAACTDILVPGITDEVTCESTVRMADPIAAGAAWFQNIDAPGTKGGTAAHWWYGIHADKTFDAEDGYGGTQIDYISDATNINIAASGGGSGPTTRVNNIYLCSNKDVVNPAESPDVCTLSSLFGSCGYAANGDPEACKINNIGLVDGAYNVFIRSATPSEGNDGFGGTDGVGSPSGCPNVDNPCCTDPATDASLNACFLSVTELTLKPGFLPAQSGVLVHGWDGTETAGTPWAPGAQQGGGETGPRWSSSYINRLNVSMKGAMCRGPGCKDPVPPPNAPPTISLYSIFSGGIVLSPANTKISCAFAQDAGTDSRPSAKGYPDGCGPKSTGEGGWCASCLFSDAAGSCVYSPLADGGSNGMCTIRPENLSAMLKAQAKYTPLASGWPRLEMAYNEVVAEPQVPGSTDTIAAFYTPIGGDPRARACPNYTDRPEIKGTQSVCCPIDPYTRQRTDAVCTANNFPDQRVTCDEMKALSEMKVDVPLLSFNPTDLVEPFTEACANWAECKAPGKPCAPPLVGT